MNGVFKFKENVFLKYKKEILLTAAAVLTLTAAVKFIPENTTTSNSTENLPVVASETESVSEEMIANGFKVYYHDLFLGNVGSYDEAQEVKNLATQSIIDQLGYTPDTAIELIIEDNYSLEALVTDFEGMVSALTASYIEGLDQVKIKAYVMKIGDDFTVAVRDQEAIKEVLRNAQAAYVNSSEFIVDINLAQDARNSLVIKPEVVMVKESLTSPDRTFTAGSGQNSDEEVGSEDQTAQETPEDQSEEKELDPYKDGETVSVGFAESVMIVETYVDEADILDVAEATELITKENEEAKVYTVVSGDVPSIIAENNDMKLEDLYKLNPDLKNNERKMQIGDELVVMVPEPELSISTEEEVTYTEGIQRGTTYVDDPEKYTTHTKTVDQGYNGTMEVKAIVKKVNGEEISREVTTKTVLTEPKDKVVSRGTKPLPPKGATGRYISPLSEYRITSTFGYRWGGFHYGVDLAASTGTTVRASDGGVVTIAGWNGNYGYLVEIDHGDGIRTRYGHNSKILVKVGQTVSQYEEIAKVGSTGRSTGPHVHFEIRFDGVCVNPLDYMTR